MLAALYLGGREKFVMTKLLEENPSMTARLLYRLLVKGGLRYPELKEEEIGTEESRNA